MPKYKKKHQVKAGRQLKIYWEQRRGKHCVCTEDENLSLEDGTSEKITDISVNPSQSVDDNTALLTETQLNMTRKNNENDDSHKIEPQEETEKTPELVIEEEEKNHIEKVPSGRRVVNIQYFFDEIKKISSHGPLGCDLQCLELVGEKQTGLKSKFKFKCGLCNSVFYVENDCDEIDINSSAVAGAIAIGCGHSQFQELTSALDLPLISPTVFRRKQELIAKKWEEIAEENMTKVGEEEKAIAIAEGRIDKNGVPIIDVVVDGCYSKRIQKKLFVSVWGCRYSWTKNWKNITHRNQK